MSSTKDKTEYNEEFEEEEYLIKDSDKKINILKHSQKDNNGAQVKPGGVQRSLSRALAYISFRSNFFLYRNKNDNLTSKQPELRQSDTDADVTCYSLFCQWLQSMRGGFLILVILVGVLVTAVVFLGQNGKKEVCGEEIYSQIYDTLKNVSSVENLSNKDSPQRRALDWIMCIDEMRLLPSVDGSSKFIQRYVLMVLYFSLNPTWSFLDDGKNWAVLNIHECQWDKIICQENQKVVKKINFRNSRISTNIPSEIGHLSNLEHFDISSNKMEGTIPYIIFSLKNLNNLFIQENNFKGKIDDKMGNLSRLERLSMHNNKFSGKLPDALKSLKNLQFLYLDHNELSGNLFDLLRHTPEITEVMSKNNYFSGTIPIEVAKLSLLRYVDISNNYFNGMIPQELKQLSLLSFLNLANNDFRGHIPSGIGLLSNLVGFSVAKCKLTGTIPNSIARLGNLETLDLSRNKISGTIPDDFGKLTELTQLNLLSNKISGNLPRTFANLTKLYQLYIQQNELKGEIHSDICALNLHRFEADCKDEVSCKCCTTCYSI